MSDRNGQVLVAKPAGSGILASMLNDEVKKGNAMSYNGWTNRETWLVNVWFNPESREDVEFARSYLEDQYDAMPDGALKDMLDLDAVNWEELLEHFEDEVEEEETEEFWPDWSSIQKVLANPTETCTIDSIESRKANKMTEKNQSTNATKIENLLFAINFMSGMVCGIALIQLVAFFSK